MQSENELLNKFRMIMNISQEVSQTQVAKHLGLSEEDLFGYLIEWSDTIPFKIRGNMIVIEDINDFMKKLDSQYNSWDQNTLISFEPIENENFTTFEELFGVNSVDILVSNDLVQQNIKTSSKLDSKLNSIRETTEKSPLASIEELIDYKFDEEEKRVIEIEGKGLKTFPKGLFVNNLDVEELYLADNEIKSIPQKIIGLHQLKILDLSENQIHSLPKHLGKLQKLKELHLNSNLISEIPPWISSLSRLKNLYLDHNRINSLSTNLLELKNLKEFHIEYNYLSRITEQEQKILDSLEARGCWVKLGVQLTIDKGQSKNLSNSAILKIFPGNEWVSIKSVIGGLRITDIEKAQELQQKIKHMVESNQLETTVRKGKKYWKILE